jgi:hypothetical protein
MGLVRKEHWDTRFFHPFLLERAKVPFSWNGNDCCLFTADAINSITGVDIAAELRGKYKTKIGALKAIKSVTGGSTTEDAVAYVANKHGLEEYPTPLLVKRGDLVLVQNGDDLISAVLHLNGREAVSVAEEGLVILPITSVKRAWRV